MNHQDSGNHAPIEETLDDLGVLDLWEGFEEILTVFKYCIPIYILVIVLFLLLSKCDAFT
jgi:hypothetical protein